MRKGGMVRHEVGGGAGAGSTGYYGHESEFGRNGKQRFQVGTCGFTYIFKRILLLLCLE